MKTIVFALFALAFTGCATTALTSPATMPKTAPVNSEEIEAREMMAKVCDGEWAIAPSLHAKPVAFVTNRVVISERRWGGLK